MNAPSSKTSITSDHSLRNVKLFLVLSTSVPLAAALLPRIYRMLIKIPPIIYDTFILDMTEVWYRAVFAKLEKGEKVLDVGIGTAG